MLRSAAGSAGKLRLAETEMSVAGQLPTETSSGLATGSVSGPRPPRTRTLYWVSGSLEVTANCEMARLSVTITKTAAQRLQVTATLMLEMLCLCGAALLKEGSLVMNAVSTL